MRMPARLGVLAASLLAMALPAAAATLCWSSASDIPTWDVHSQNNALLNGIHATVYGSLSFYNARFEVEPVLATSFRQITPTQVRVTLRSGVKFHDGANFNARVRISRSAWQARTGGKASFFAFPRQSWLREVVKPTCAPVFAPAVEAEELIAA